MENVVKKKNPIKYQGADKSLARPGWKQARKHFRNARDFNNIETRAVIKFFSPGRQGKAPKEIVSFLVGLRTYQHPYSHVLENLQVYVFIIISKIYILLE